MGRKRYGKNELGPRSKRESGIETWFSLSRVGKGYGLAFRNRRGMQPFDIRCNPADGDRCYRFKVAGRRTLVVIYNVGGDFYSIPKEERRKRVQNLFKLIDFGARKVKDQVESTFEADI